VAEPADLVTHALQAYADRGVFRGLSVAAKPGGRYQYGFHWLMQRQFTLTFDPKRRVLGFRQLFPGVGARSSMLAALKRVVDQRATRHVPAHKRFDGRRIRAAVTLQRGRVSLEMEVRGSQYAYAVRQLLNLVNELFLVLHETYPDYLMAHFGLSEE
jgi:hypothetical protein